MNNFDTQYLQLTSVEIVTDFLEKKGSLDELIAKKAEHDSLNEQQVKRVIEASNTIAFLKTLQTSADRTQEFPVASYDGVMADLQKPLQKEAQLSPQELVKYKTIAKRKKMERLSQEQEAMLKKAVLQTAQEVERDFGEYKDCLERAVRLRSELQKEANLFEKVAALGDVEKLQEFLNFIDAPMEKSASYVPSSEKEGFRHYYDQYVSLSDSVEKYQTKAAFLSEAFEKSAGLFGLVGTGIRKMITSPIIAGAKSFAKGSPARAMEKEEYSKSFSAAAKYAKQNGMKTGEAITHLSQPANAAAAGAAGFNPAHVANYKSGFATATHKAGVALNVGFAGLAAKDMKHNPDTQVKGL